MITLAGPLKWSVKMAVKEDSTWQLDCDLAAAVDLTQGSLDSETDSVVRMPCTGPKAQISA